MLARLAAWLVRPEPPPLGWGIAAGALFVVLETLLAYPLAQTAPREAIGALFLPGVLIVAIVWGLRLGVATAIASALAFDFFHVHPLRRFTLADLRDWLELAVLLLTAALGGALARLARSRAAEATQRRGEADLIAGLARLVLGAGELPPVLPEAARRIADTLGMPSCSIVLDDPGTADGEPRVVIPLRLDNRTGALVVPAGLPPPVLRRLYDRVLSPLEALLSAAGERAAAEAALRTLAAEQAILRRVAVLVAHGAPPADVVTAVAAETARLLGADATRLLRHEAPGTVTVVAEYGKPGFDSLVGRRLDVSGGVAELVLRTSRPARMDSYGDRRGTLADLARTEGMHSSVAAPVLVDGGVWGVLTVLWARPDPPPPGVEQRLAQFTELVATAVANAEDRAELTRSRARLVFAADEARRRIERDLHDGVQQRLVSLGLELRAAEALVPAQLGELRDRLSRTTDGLRSAFDDLQEISRGIHPAILSQGGLGSAIKALARRSPVPVAVRTGPRRRLPIGVEVAAYYVVSEALTNAAKHAAASEVDIDIEFAPDPATRREQLILSVRDDGAGGADPSLGSGLAGLRDRVEAIGGRLRIASPAGGGTHLSVTLPLEDSQVAART
ncbi:DUF4118 domain-containing protein [Dactylosporangium sucinum]|uniref:histidine kinase n=1 Tax=Dactylosporangium sucinum TaxID=1424081 RepID=A0A917UCG8_9ACTN|nr:DUF4118 domain-containing protein [Dactylosporangium sucinum]GGM77581.1 hypothetical protein GCM10007977_093800 [Dactylosporangium sucinum]GGM77663.1 hypothetical protein GCM10007977_093890 [Dactylosporangium sucinum]